MVEFYGQRMARAAILQTKHAYLQRWPVRSYRPRLASTSVVCEAEARVCTISGIVDWESSSPARGARSTGSAAFSLRVGFGTGPLILGESGNVLARSAGP